MIDVSEEISPSVDVVKKILSVTEFVRNQGLNDQRSTALAIASKNGHARIVDAILSAGRHTYGINHTLTRGWTSLHGAASYGHASIVERLLGVGGIDVNAFDANGKTSLHLASEAGHAGVVRHLVSSPGIRPNAETTLLRHSALWLAVSSGWANVVAELVASPGTDVNFRAVRVPPAHHPGIADDAATATALHLAVSLNNVAVMTELLRSPRVDFSARDERSLTPLGLAAQLNAQNALRVLVRAASADGRFDVNEPCSVDEQETPLTLAVRARDPLAVGTLLRTPGIRPDSGPNATALCRLVVGGSGSESGSGSVDNSRLPVVEELLACPEVRTDVTLRTSGEDMSLLECARRFGTAEIADTIAAYDRDPGGRRAFSVLRAVNWAHWDSEADLRSYIERYGLNVNEASARDGTTALHIGAGQDDLEAVRRLLALGADPTLSSARGKKQTPLHVAAACASHEVVSELLSMPGVDKILNRPDAEGCTALHLAADAGRLKVLGLLLRQKGVDIGAKSKCNWTAMDYAFRAQQHRAERMISKAMAGAPAPEKN